MEWMVGGEKIKGCPQKLVTPGIIRALDIWLYMRTYGLARSGGWAEQPVIFMDIADNVNLIAAEWQEKEAKKKKGSGKEMNLGDFKNALERMR